MATVAQNEQQPPQPQAEPEAEPQPTGRVKKHKKPKLSKAEKKRLRLLEEMALKKRLMKEQLLREIALTNKSVKRGKIEWERTLKEIKLEEFRDEVKEWGKKTTLLLEKKDEKINKLMKNIDETHEMQERNFSQHLQQLEYLTDCHKTLRDAASALYEMQATQLVEDFLQELSQTMAIQARIKLNTENIVHSSNIVAKDRLKNNFGTYMERKFDIVCTEVEKRYILRDRTVKIMRSLQDQLLLWIHQLQGDMVDVRRTEKFLYFMNRQQNYVKESTKLNELEKHSQKTLSDLQQELLNLETESVRQMNSLKLEQEYFLKVRSLIKSSIMRHKQMTHMRLLSEAGEAYKVINKLKETVRNGEFLLALAACCRKHQTEKEKVNPISPGEDQDPANDKDFMFQLSFNPLKHLDISSEEIGEQMATLKHFWRRCSNVHFHNLMLMANRAKLREENESFRNIIRSLKKSDDVTYILEALQIQHLLTRSYIVFNFNSYTFHLQCSLESKIGLYFITEDYHTYLAKCKRH